MTHHNHHLFIEGNQEHPFILSEGGKEICYEEIFIILEAKNEENYKLVTSHSKNKQTQRLDLPEINFLTFPVGFYYNYLSVLILIIIVTI